MTPKIVLSVVSNFWYTFRDIEKRRPPSELPTEDTVAISFPFNTRKAVEVIAWLVNEKPGVDLYTIVKVLYYADKDHLQRYGRPVIGDRYFAMEHGMVPSIVYDALSAQGMYGNDLRDVLSEAIETRIEEFPTYYPRREADEDLLSGSDMRCLRAALDKCAGLSFNQLKRLAHNERAYAVAWRSKPSQAEAVPMDYELIIDEDHEKRELLLRQLGETAPYMAL